MSTYRKDLSLFNKVSSIIKPILAKRGIHIYQIIVDWPKIMQNWDIIQQLQKQDSQVVNKIYPTKIKWNETNQTGVLYVSVARKYFIYARHDDISLRDAVNKYFGYKAINKIIFIKS